MDLVFKKAKSNKHIKDVFDHTIDAFSDTPDFNWTLDEIENEIHSGWDLYSAEYESEIIAAVFLIKEKGVLHSKNTGIKMGHKGSGFSHEIKEWIEQQGRKLKCDKILHYCRIDNFRLYTLNEKHGYKKTKNIYSDGQVVEWEKKIK